MNKRLVFYKIDAFDTEKFLSEIAEGYGSWEGIIFNPTGPYRVVSSKKRCSGDRCRYLISEAMRRRCPSIVFKFIFPLLFFADFVRISFLLSKLIKAVKPTHVYCDNTYIATFFSMYKFVSSRFKFHYAAMDWFRVSREQSLPRNIHSLVFLLADYLNCRMCDVCINHSEALQDERNNFWGKTISKQQFIPSVTSFLSIHGGVMSKKIEGGFAVFLGNIQDELLLAELATICADCKIRLRVITSSKVSPKLREHPNIDLRLRLARNAFAENITGGVCGFALVKDASHSTYTIPSKVIDYFNYGLPVLITSNIVSLVPFVVDNGLGRVIQDISRETIRRAILELESEKSVILENLKDQQRTNEPLRYV